MTDIDRSPATLFVRYWELATTWTATQRAAVTPPDHSFRDACAIMLANDDGADAHDQVEMLVEAKSTSEDKLRGRVLAAMSAIDQVFYKIHPRALAQTTPSGGTVVPAAWLRDLRGDRGEGGHYALTPSRKLIPRGPLLRDPRGPDASSGDRLADRFAALTVVPRSLQHDERVIEVSTIVVPIAASNGVLASVNPGAERVGFVPLATVAGQIEVTASYTASRMFANYKPAHDFDAAAVAMDAVVALGKVDVVIMPELALSADHVEELSRAMACLAPPTARVVISGSNLTTDLGDGLPFNECRVMNGRGVELWRQRKLWTAGLGRERAIEWGLPDPGNDALVLENTACGMELVVADIDGFGRCVVLICQDVTAPLLAIELLDRFQPDWVFVPILDKTIDEGRWAHSRAYGLSELSQARFIAITNTSFAGTFDPAKPEGMGFAVGPKEPTDRADLRRALAVVPRPGPADPAWASLTWREGAWQQSVIEAV